MAIIIMVLRKMIKNKLLTVCMTIGLVVAVALLSSIPMYTEGVLQRMVVKEIEQFQINTGKFGGSYQVGMSFFGDMPFTKRKMIYNQINKFIQNNMTNAINLPILANIINCSTVEYPIIREGEDIKKIDRGRRASLRGISDIEKHIDIIDGRLPVSNTKNNIYEVMVTENALNKLDLVLGNVYILTEPGSKNMRPIKIKPVGIFVPRSQNDMWWYSKIDTYDNSILVNSTLFIKDFVQSQTPLIGHVEWYYAFDYRDVSLNEIQKFITGENKVSKFASEIYPKVDFDVPAIEILKKYLEEEKQLRLILWALSTPVILLLAFYIFMISSLIVESERNEIAVLRSRGSSRIQILYSYLIEGLMLGIIAMIVGPPIGYTFTRFLGSTSGFLEFVQRKFLHINLSLTAYRYGLTAMIGSVLMLMIPAFSAAKESIVGYKQGRARKLTAPFWQRYLLDIILMGISGLGYYLFDQRQQILVVTGVKSSEINVDPLLFFASTLFAIGTGLFFLRIYPWMIETIYRLGSRWWNASIYASLTQVGRSLTKYQLLMIFLILTIANGLFNANAARTINNNAEERIRYKIGADITLSPAWESDEPTANPLSGSNNQPIKEPQYQEPPLEPYMNLKGVAGAAKVFNRQGVEAYMDNNNTINNVSLMAINPYEFSKVIWFRSDLMEYHINQYLNLLNEDPSAVLLSRSFADLYHVKLGDAISLSWGDLDLATFYVYGFVDYWPSWNPNKDTGTLDSDVPMLVVANLPYVQNQLKLEPYDIWLKLKVDATSQALYDDIEKKKLLANNIQNLRQEIIKSKNEPFSLAMNGILTLGFLITIIITFLGFIIYWMLSFGKRSLEFGVLRAMGFSVGQLITMISWEQVLTSGAAAVMGGIIGNIASKYFVPLFQFSADAVDQVPPFRVISLFGDRAKLYIVIIAMLITGLSILGKKVSNLKIDQAIKLGED